MIDEHPKDLALPNAPSAGFGSNRDWALRPRNWRWIGRHCRPPRVIKFNMLPSPKCHGTRNTSLVPIREKKEMHASELIDDSLRDGSFPR